METPSEFDRVTDEAYRALIPRKSAKTYERCFEDYAAWMESVGKNPAETSDITLLTYIQSKFNDGMAASTLQSKLSSIRGQLQARRIPVPDLSICYQWIRQKMVTHVPKQAATFNSSEMIAYFSMDDSSVLHLQQKLAAMTMYYLGLRHGEIVFLAWKDVELYDEKVRICIRHSKTDQAGQGIWLIAPANSDEPQACVAVTWKTYWSMLPETLRAQDVESAFSFSFSTVNLRIGLSARSVSLLYPS